ncbi:hypothetical protein Tco_1213800 [Tanacetum coccineum]
MGELPRSGLFLITETQARLDPESIDLRRANKKHVLNCHWLVRRDIPGNQNKIPTSKGENHVDAWCLKQTGEREQEESKFFQPTTPCSDSINLLTRCSTPTVLVEIRLVLDNGFRMDWPFEVDCKPVVSFDLPNLKNLRHLDRLNSKNYKKYRVGGVPKSHGEDIDEGVL